MIIFQYNANWRSPIGSRVSLTHVRQWNTPVCKCSTQISQFEVTGHANGFQHREVGSRKLRALRERRSSADLIESFPKVTELLFANQNQSRPEWGGRDANVVVTHKTHHQKSELCHCKHVQVRQTSSCRQKLWWWWWLLLTALCWFCSTFIAGTGSVHTFLLSSHEQVNGWIAVFFTLSWKWIKCWWKSHNFLSVKQTKKVEKLFKKNIFTAENEKHLGFAPIECNKSFNFQNKIVATWYLHTLNNKGRPFLCLTNNQNECFQFNDSCYIICWITIRIKKLFQIRNLHIFPSSKVLTAIQKRCKVASQPSWLSRFVFNYLQLFKLILDAKQTVCLLINTNNIHSRFSSFIKLGWICQVFSIKLTQILSFFWMINFMFWF